MKDTRPKYPNQLKEFRIAKGLKQKAVATILGFTDDSRVSMWEHGLMVPHLINLLKLCKLYKVQADELYPELLEIYK